MAWIDISVVAAALAVICAWLVVVLLRRARRSQRRFEILGRVAAVSESDGSLENTFEAICDILVPEIADFCMIDVIEDGEPKRVAARVSSNGSSAAEQRLRERQPSLPEWMVSGEDGSLEPRFYERMSEDDLRELARDDDDLAFLRSLRMRSAITLALQARGQVKGTLTLGVAWSGRRYNKDDVRFAWILSGRVALTLDNSGLFADLEQAEAARAEVAETLQRGLMPPPLPHIPGWSLAAMYRPAGAENEVGGDFYDAFPVADGWMLVIGDVTGRGARAASITALARYTLRTAAALTNDPQIALATLNRALLARPDTSLCSIAALTLSDDPRQPVRMAVAGHLPPLLVDGEEVREAAASDQVLGAFAEGEWRIGECQVEPGQQLVITTDGIVEAEGEAGRFGEERLRAELAGAGNPAGTVQRLEGALRAFTADTLDDDVAILAVARSAEGAVPPVPVAGGIGIGGDG
jgi:serine phosphatase RsbU (regulator of sigma subunit)